jgi:hypothetical protein
MGSQSFSHWSVILAGGMRCWGQVSLSCLAIICCFFAPETQLLHRVGGDELDIVIIRLPLCWDDLFTGGSLWSS